MQNGNRVRVRVRSGVTVRSWIELRFGSRLYFILQQPCAISRSYNHSALHRCGMAGMALRLQLGSVVRFKARIARTVFPLLVVGLQQTSRGLSHFLHISDALINYMRAMSAAVCYISTDR